MGPLRELQRLGDGIVSTRPFAVRFTWEVDEGVPVPLVVSGTYDASPGNRRGHPDTWTEPWVELDVSSIRVTNSHECPLPAAVVGALCARDCFLRAVEEKIEEGAHGL
jgi:hypothetical protein